MHEFDFSDDEWRALTSALDFPAQDLREWVMLQISRGQEYYVRYLQRLGMAGDRVLDAGCGMGNWSLGLARLFNQVDALEIDSVRLKVLEQVAGRVTGRFQTRIGSIEQLPYEKDTFDTVFCNGVIFQTDVERSLSEFMRVLKPEGRLYLTFSSKMWWKHLILNRGPNEPECLRYGCNGIIDFLFNKLDRFGLENRVSTQERGRLTALLINTFPSRGSWISSRKRQAIDAFEQFAAEETHRNAVVEPFVDAALNICNAAFAAADQRHMLPDLVDSVYTICDHGLDEHKNRMYRELVSRLVLGRRAYTSTYNTRSFEPEEMSAVLTKMGFRRVLISLEGTLALKGGVPSVPPINADFMGVYEVLAVAPAKTLELRTGSVIPKVIPA